MTDPLPEPTPPMHHIDLGALFTSRPWQDYAFLFMLAVILIKTFLLLSTLQQLPSPLYGGDVYFHFGVINHIYTGNYPWTHNHFLNEYAHYPWISHLLVAVIALLSRMDILIAAIFFPLVTTGLAAIISYSLGILIFGNRSIALLYSLYWSTFQVPHTAASPFAELVVYPLFLLFLCKAGSSLRSRIIAGVAFGLTGLAQVITWVGAIMTLGFLWLWRILSESITIQEGSIRINRPTSFHDVILQFWNHTRWFIPIILTGLPIALLFWGPPLFIYRGVTPNNWSAYVSLGPTLTPAIALETLGIWFFNTESWRTLIISLGTLLGFLLSFRTPSRFSIPLITGLVAVIGLLHPLIKEVGIGFYAFGYIYDAARGLLFLTLIYVVYKSLGGWKKNLFYTAVLWFLVVNALFTFAIFEQDRWVNAGRSPNPQYLIARWAMENTALDSVFLVPNEETGFAWNAMTGRKVMIARRTHTSPFVDVNQRSADTGIILYGTNQTLIEELVRKHHIQFLYEDFYSTQNQEQCATNFEAISHTKERPDLAEIALSCLLTDPSKESYIKAAGLTTATSYHTRLDPASVQAPRFTMIAIQPTNYSSWLLNHTELIKQGNLPDGTAYQRLFKITPY